jgi:type I site-specific restriction endonuclease
MNKKGLSERDICSKFIGPAVKRAGWDGMMQIRDGMQQAPDDAVTLNIPFVCSSNGDRFRLS